jgi:formylglycine-generating enzyme required for sulfatase activity
MEAAYLPNDSLLGFVEIPAGRFVMGSDPGADSLAFDIERWSGADVQGRLDLPTFYLGRYEVTVAQYAAFVTASRHRPVDARALQAPPDHPVTWVSWADAVAYAAWLDQELRESDGTPEPLARLLLEGWRVSLATEAQWEKAARGDDGRIYPWGNLFRSERANVRSRATTPVGSFPCPECPYPLADLSGNVWEWTRSPFQPYPYDERDDRTRLDGDALWVMRGGAFGDAEQMARAANRGAADPGARRPFIGFRIALSRE